jgi:hypothetical protein
MQSLPPPPKNVPCKAAQGICCSYGWCRGISVTMMQLHHPIVEYNKHLKMSMTLILTVHPSVAAEGSVF